MTENAAAAPVTIGVVPLVAVAGCVALAGAWRGSRPPERSSAGRRRADPLGVDTGTGRKVSRHRYRAATRGGGTGVDASPGWGSIGRTASGAAHVLFLDVEQCL